MNLICRYLSFWISSRSICFRTFYTTYCSIIRYYTAKSLLAQLVASGAFCEKPLVVKHFWKLNKQMYIQLHWSLLVVLSHSFICIRTITYAHEQRQPGCISLNFIFHLPHMVENTNRIAPPSGKVGISQCLVSSKLNRGDPASNVSYLFNKLFGCWYHAQMWQMALKMCWHTI